MKQLFFLISICITTMTYAADPVWDAVVNAFKSSNASSLSAYMESSIDISIVDNDQNLVKAKAIAAIQGFINTNRPKNFTAVHQGSSQGKNSWYSIGELETANGKFRVFVYFKNSAGGTMIHEIRINPS